MASRIAAGTRALVCSEDERLAQALRDGGFEVTVAAAGADALERLRQERWAVVGMDDAPPREAITYVDELPGRRRRELFVVRLGDRFETGDRFQAWAQSADLVVHPADLARLGELVPGEMEEKEGFYAWFRLIQEQAGARLGAHA